MNVSNKLWKVILGILASGLLLFFIFKQIKLSDIIGQALQIKWPFTLSAFALYLAINSSRAWRFKIMLKNNTGLLHLLKIVFVQNFFNVILPMRLGELSYVHLINKTRSVSLGKNIASLFASRILDLLCVSITFLFSSLILRNAMIIPGYLLLAAGVFFLTMIIISVLLIFYGKSMVQVFYYILKTSRVSKWKIFSKILNILDETAAGFTEMKEKDVLFKIFLVSLFIWLLNFTEGSLLLKGVGIHLQFWSLIFVYTFPLLASVIPFLTFGSLGLYEGSTVFALFIFGIEKTTAVSSSLLLHTIDLLFVLITGLIGLSSLYIPFKSSSYSSFK
jgi:uncharacterized protein (TIRG00374 family)